MTNKKNGKLEVNTLERTKKHEEFFLSKAWNPFFYFQFLGLKGNPITPDLMALYTEVNGTRKLLEFMLDSLHGRTQKVIVDLPYMIYHILLVLR